MIEFGSRDFISVILVLLLGSVFGSFATVLNYRVLSGESVVFPRSHCRNCLTPLKLKDNIPVISYILLRGKCRLCETKIESFYPLIEVVTSLLFLISFLNAQSIFSCLALFSLATFTMPLVISDLKVRRLPNAYTYSGFILGVIFSFGQTIFVSDWNFIQNSLLYSCSGLIFYFLLFIVSRGGMGLGDVKLSAMIGALLFFSSWKEIVASNMIAFILGSIYGVSLILRGKATRKTAIPFGPFMLLGAWLNQLSQIF